jgi:hypothetical protein
MGYRPSQPAGESNSSILGIINNLGPVLFSFERPESLLRYEFTAANLLLSAQIAFHHLFAVPWTICIPLSELPRQYRLYYRRFLGNLCVERSCVVLHVCVFGSELH